ncbi:hypothetical protein ACTWPB_20720 [Nocardia sp. IBHARD005]|uniref:hypothetical protein n=1 Tax=Nocardia sp. IBHARD005 TaxID=3457765 RepID=UPI004059429C
MVGHHVVEFPGQCGAFAEAGTGLRLIGARSQILREVMLPTQRQPEQQRQSHLRRGLRHHEDQAVMGQLLVLAQVSNPRPRRWTWAP